jgi:hypothetical protein
MREITWKGKRIAIKNEKLRMSILSAQETIYELEKAASIDSKMALFDKLFLSYTDSLDIIRDELNAKSVPPYLYALN